MIDLKNIKSAIDTDMPKLVESANDLVKKTLGDFGNIESFVKQNKDKFTDEQLRIFQEQVDNIKNVKKDLNGLKNSK